MSDNLSNSVTSDELISIQTFMLHSNSVVMFWQLLHLFVGLWETS